MCGSDTNITLSPGIYAHTEVFSCMTKNYSNIRQNAMKFLDIFPGFFLFKIVFPFDYNLKVNLVILVF